MVYILLSNFKVNIKEKKKKITEIWASITKENRDWASFGGDGDHR